MAANNNSEWWGVMRNKLAVTTLLGGYGFPVIPTLALYSDAICMRGIPILREPAALAGLPAQLARLSAVRQADGFPAQPGLDRPGSLRRPTPTASLPDEASKIPVDEFAAAVAEHYKGGYIFQRRISPHAGVRAIAGDRLATVRAITILTEKGPQLLRALWKIPAGDNVADNFWRSGNLLATLDLETGRVVRVVRGSGLALEEVTHHPDTGAELVGIEVPNWREIVGLALDAASTLTEVPLIGWDMAAVEDGALIVEPNFTPDFFMTQLADRRGMLDARFNAFLASCKAAAQRTKKMRRAGTDSRRPRAPAPARPGHGGRAPEGSWPRTPSVRSSVARAECWRPPERAPGGLQEVRSRRRLRGLHRGGDGVEGGADLRAEPGGRRR